MSMQWKVTQPFLKKKKILPFVMTWLDLEDIMLIEKVRQRKANTVSSRLYVGSKKSKLKKIHEQ